MADARFRPPSGPLTRTPRSVSVGGMDVERVRLELLRPAVDGLRRALQRMEAKDVPAGLRRLADTAARRVPPPLLARAVAELDESEWLRAETAAESTLEEDSASHLFVVRPPEWEKNLQRLVEEVSSRRDERQSSRTDQLLAAAKDRVSKLEGDLRALRKAADDAERRGEERHRAKLAAAKTAHGQAAKEARTEVRRRQAAEKRMAELEAALEAAEARVESQRQLLEKERRAAAETPPAHATRGWFPSDPEEMATELDRIVTAVGRPRRQPPVARANSAPVAHLPDGLRPDRKEAVGWLLKHPLTWLIDGYNLAFQLDDEPDSVTRDRVLDAAGRLVALSVPATMAVVVFDSSVDEFSGTADRRVAVVYAPSADERIIDDARPGTVVVSSDRRVREEAQRAGAIGLWSEAMAAWILSGPAR